MSAGFDRAPITRFLVGLCGVSSAICIFISSRRKSVFPLLNLSSADIFERFQVWRLLSTHVFFGSAAELFLGLVLLYNFRLFERHFGARKFGGAIFFFLLAATLLDLALLAVIPSEYFAATATGPYAIVFALLPSFIIDIPKVAPFKVFGIPMSEKFMTYAVAMQLALVDRPASFFTGAIAFIVGALYRWERLPFHKLRVPASLVRCCERVSAQLSAVTAGPAPRFGGGRVGGSSGNSLLSNSVQHGSTPPSSGARGSAGGSPDLAGYVAGGGGGPGGYDRVPVNDSDSQPSGALPNSAGVSQLVSMGFGEMEARTALSASNNNVEAAMNLLLASR